MHRYTKIIGSLLCLHIFIYMVIEKLLTVLKPFLIKKLTEQLVIAFDDNFLLCLG